MFLSPPVVLHGIARRADGTIELSVAIGRDAAPQAYEAHVTTGDPELRCISFAEPLFFELSELSVRRYGNCMLYHSELGELVTAFHYGQAIPLLPARLGTTPFARPPALPRLLWDQSRRLLIHLGLIEPKMYGPIGGGGDADEGTDR